MGGCLFREKEYEELAVQPLQTQFTDEVIVDELEDIRDIAKLKNCEILFITLLNHKCIVLRKQDDKTMNLRVIEIVGNRNMMYLEIHKQLQYAFMQLRQCQNFFIGAVTLKDKCFMVLRTVQGLAAQVSVQEIQCLGISENLSEVMKKRFDERFLCVGVIYIEDMVILVFRKIFLKIKCPILQKYTSPSNDTICIIQYEGQIYELKKKL
ncbi:unnamed protein product (macronuclear) [Paramecium tetraurelia]|uniref:Uncharacterized protein n=1 Tax=Paramecium tetraurelia TaxID=5888 RepID=A0C6V7_PARTE|nr:uncharacterized protein GSPATT00035653001 [Paramecium tetraurelia]CAK66524.1 unnamed protein product [Paramecium tetraurelia]|eukprot:XP_001433921.1 hypothetical protein (macronuclear) [Paramecium tetraurelia strain d4-2]